MKKTLSLILVLILCISLCACGSGSQSGGKKATITWSNGSTETVTAQDIYNNPIKYKDAEICVTSTVTRIAEDSYGIKVYLDGDWEVWMDREAFAKYGIDVGVYIRVEGVVFDADSKPIDIAKSLGDGRHTATDKVSLPD